MRIGLGIAIARCRMPSAGGRHGRRSRTTSDVDGRAHAIAAGVVAVICDAEDGALLMLPGGRMVRVPEDLATVLGWLDAR